MNNKPTSTTVIEPTEIAVTQTIIRAQNGDVIVADETGLRMRLSDRVIEDIAMRLGKSGHGFGAMPQRDDTNNLLADVDPSSQAEELSYFIGENIDCWDIQQRGEFASFMADLPGRQGVRGFLKHLKGGGIIADTAGPLQVIWPSEELARPWPQWSVTAIPITSSHQQTILELLAVVVKQLLRKRPFWKGCGR